jgi:hypothetical protein
VESLTAGETNKGSLLYRAVGKCPEATVWLNGKEIRCLVDTGAQVSTITESFYRDHFVGRSLADVSNFINVKAANGKDLPILGYVEFTMRVFDQNFENLGFLVVRDPEDSNTRSRKQRVPGVIGSNVFRDMKSSVDMENVPKEWQTILALYEEICAERQKDEIGRVRVAGHAPVLVPAGSIQIIEGSVRKAKDSYTALVEELDASVIPLQRGLALGPSLVTVTGKGSVPVQVANFTDSDIYIQPRTPIAMLRHASLEPQVEVVEVGACEIEVRDISDTAVTSEVARQLIDKMDIGGGIGNDCRDKLAEVINKHEATFSKTDEDIGFCDAVKHKIITTDDIPVKLAHRRIPPQQWEEVREYLAKSLESGMIRESSSPYASPVVLVKKANGKLQICCDYRALNAKTRKDHTHFLG